MHTTTAPGQNSASFLLLMDRGDLMRKGHFTGLDKRIALGGDAGEPRGAARTAHREGRLLIIAILLAAPVLCANAQTLYRCVQSGKPTSYQNNPCPPTAKTASATDYVPERNVSPPRAPAPATRYGRGAMGGQFHNIPRATSPSACEFAKQHRENVLGKNNQGGNVDIRRQLNDAVARACN